MNCSEIKEMINQIGIKALCNNLSNVCSRACIESNYDCKCICDTNTDDDGYVDLYCDVNIDTYHRVIYYLINFILILTFCIFCCGILALCKRVYRKKSTNNIVNLPTYNQSQYMQYPPPYIIESNVQSNESIVDEDILPPPTYSQNLSDKQI